MQKQQKSVVETDSKSSKIIDPGASRGDAPSGAKGRVTTWMSRIILAKPPALAAEGEKQVFSSPNSVLISPYELSNDLWTQPKVSSEEKASRLPPIRSLFFHHYDWNRWIASLATTVDNTIKMADRNFKHGRQWCIRRIANVRSLPLSFLHLSALSPISLSLSLSLPSNYISLLCNSCSNLHDFNFLTNQQSFS